nr:hypothetical protein [Tanacetum cinerariifolium]
MQASLQGKDNVIIKFKNQISQLQETRSDTDLTLIVKYKVLARGKHAIDVEPIVPRLRNNRDAHLDYLRHLKESVETIRDIVEETKVTRSNEINNLLTFLSLGKSKLLSPTHLIRQIVTHRPVAKVHTQKTNVHVPPSTGVKCYTNASGSQPRTNTKKNRISPAKGCSKHMTGDRSRLMNFVKKFIGTVRFGNDHFGAIMGYGDYAIGSSDISRTVPKTPQQNGIVERRNHTLVKAARMMLIFSKAPMFLWAEVVAIACYTQNRSLIHTRHNKIPYELVHNKKPNLTFFRVFDALCYPTNDSKDLGKLQPTADIGIFVGYAPSRKWCIIYNKRTRRIMETIHVQFDELTDPMAHVHLSTGPAPNLLMPGQISSRLVLNPVPATPYVLPINKDLEILFQPLLDEYLEPPRAERPVHPAQAVQAPVNSAGTPSSTTIDQDAPSLSISLSSSALQSHSLHQGITAESTFMEDNHVAPVDNTPFINVFTP